MSFLQTLPRFLLILASVLMVTPEVTLAGKPFGRKKACRQVLSDTIPQFVNGTAGTQYLAGSLSSKLDYGTQGFFLHSLRSSVGYLRQVAQLSKLNLEVSTQLLSQIKEIETMIKDLLSSPDIEKQKQGVSKLNHLWQLMVDFKEGELFHVFSGSHRKYHTIFSEEATSTFEAFINGRSVPIVFGNKIAVKDESVNTLGMRQALVHQEMSGLEIGEFLLSGILPVNLSLSAVAAHRRLLPPDSFADHDIGHNNGFRRVLISYGFTKSKWRQFLNSVNASISVFDSRRPLLQALMVVLWEGHSYTEWVSPMRLDHAYKNFADNLRYLNEQSDLGVTINSDQLREVAQIIVDTVNSLNLEPAGYWQRYAEEVRSKTDKE